MKNPLAVALILCAAALALAACETTKSSDDSPGSKSTSSSSTTTASGSGAPTPSVPSLSPADPKTIEFDRHARTLSATLLNPHAGRDLALGSVVRAVFGFQPPRDERPAKVLALACEALRQGGCAALAPELHYYAVLEATLTQLAQAARAQGDAQRAQALETWRDTTAELVGAGFPAKVPTAAEPLRDLDGEPVLLVRGAPEAGATVDVLVGPAVVRSLDGALAEANPAFEALLDALETGDLYTATGLMPPAEGTVEKQPGTPLRILVAADEPVGAALELVRRAYAARKLQRFELVVRSDQYGTLSVVPLNVVNTSVRGSKHGVQLGLEQVTWREDSGGGEGSESLQGVSWTSLERLSELVRVPPGQLVLYVEIADALSGQQLADALSALRRRCGEDVAMCPTLQLAVALKPLAGTK